MNKRDLTGHTFGMLTATRFDHKGRRGLSFYEFKCECGEAKVLCGTDVSQGKTKSCGCVHWTSKRSHWLPRGEASFNSLYKAYQYGAKSRSLNFSLTREEFGRLTKEPCTYCGVNPYKEFTGTNKGSSAYLYNGLDRVNNSEGYVVGNVVSCCQICNQAKHSLSIEQFKEWIARVVKFNTVKVAVTTAGRN